MHSHGGMNEEGMYEERQEACMMHGETEHSHFYIHSRTLDDEDLCTTA